MATDVEHVIVPVRRRPLIHPDKPQAVIDAIARVVGRLPTDDATTSWPRIRLAALIRVPGLEACD